MTRRSRYSPEVKERAVGMVFDQQAQHESQWSAISSIASKIDCTRETLRTWVRRAERDAGKRVPWCTTPIEAESSLGPDSHHPIISLSGIPSAVMVLRILHPILASTLCAANPSCAKTRPF